MGEWLSSAGGQGSSVGCLLVNAPSSRVDRRPTPSHPPAPLLPPSDTRSAAVARFTFVIVVVQVARYTRYRSPKNIALLAPYIIATTVPPVSAARTPCPTHRYCLPQTHPRPPPKARPPPGADSVVLRLSSQVA
jgi:hypothetical protein